MTQLTLDNFKQEVVDHPGIVVIDAYADYCPGCLRLSYVLKPLMQKYPDIKFTSLNISRENAIREAFNIQSAPYVLFFKNGHFVTGRYSPDTSLLEDEIDQLRRT